MSKKPAQIYELAKNFLRLHFSNSQITQKGIFPSTALGHWYFLSILDQYVQLIYIITINLVNVAMYTQSFFYSRVCNEKIGP